jgi:hypothetical protein
MAVGHAGREDHGAPGDSGPSDRLRTNPACCGAGRHPPYIGVLAIEAVEAVGGLP